MTFEQYTKKRKQANRNGETRETVLPQTRDEKPTSFAEYTRQKKGIKAWKDSEQPTEGKVKSSDNDTSLKLTDYNTATRNAYTSVKDRVNATTTITSDLTDDERKARIKEIETEIQQLNAVLNGIGRAGAYGSSEPLKTKKEETQKRKAELSQELKSLERVGTFTVSELKQFEIDDAKARKAALPNYNPTARVAPSDVDAFKGNVLAHSALDKEIDRLEREKALYDNISKFGDVVNYDDSAAKAVYGESDSFPERLTDKILSFEGQWKANYRSNELSREADKAMSEYIRNPTEENRQIAYAYDALAKEYQKNNEKSLDDEGEVLPWLSKSLAGYLPQFKDQIVPELVGGSVGLALGAAAGAPTVGASLGAGLGTYSQMYDVMRGSVYRTLLAEGVDEKTALKAAEDEALISSLIEGGETALGWLLAGGGKALNAIGNAAKSSVAKGSTNVATKLLAGFASKSATTKAAEAVTRPLWKTAARTGVGIVGNAVTEYGEEFTQGAVSRANKERALSTTPVDGKGQLVKGASKVVTDAVTGKDPEALAELHEQGVEGFKIGLMFGGANTVVNNVVSHYANAKTIEERNRIADVVVKDEETLTALVEEGKASGTVSAKIAEKIEQTKAKGKEVTREQVKRLIASNEVYRQAEEQASTTDTLEQAARDVAEKRAKVDGIELLEARKRGKVNEEVLDRLTEYKVEITPDEVKKVTGFGDSGSVLIAKLANDNGISFTQAKNSVQTAYQAGLTGVDKRKANFFNDTQRLAFEAGREDARVRILTAKENAENVVVHKESGFNMENLPSDVTPTQAEIVDLMAKSLGVKSYVAKGLKGNAELRNATGEVPIDFDFEREIGTGANRQKVSIVFHAAHEMALHRVVELAPEEGNAFVFEMYKHLAGNEPSTYTLADQKRDEYAKQGVNISLADAMEELSANHILPLYGNDETKFRNAIDRIVNGTNEKAKRGLRKYIDYLKDFIRKIREILAGKTAAERTEIQAGLDEVTRLRDMFETAYAKAVENAKATQSKNAYTNPSNNLEIKINEDYNGNISHSLKGQYWHTDLSKTQVKQVEEWIRQAGKPETTKITDTANWYKGRIDGEDLFVIYSTEDANAPTILYERKGVEARAELDILLEHMEDVENGRSIVEISKDINTLLGGDWVQAKHDMANNDDRPRRRGGNPGYATILQGKSSKFIGSKAFRNVIKNLFEIQEQDRALNEGKSYSLKDIDNLGYHAGDLGKGESLGSQGYYRDTGHFGRGTYFVGNKELVKNYNKRDGVPAPQHAVDFSNYKLYKIKSDKDGYDLHEQLRIIDGGINKDWIERAPDNEFRLYRYTEFYDIAEKKFGEESKYTAEALIYGLTELAKKANIEIPTAEQYSKESGYDLSDEFFESAYEVHLKEVVKEKLEAVNEEYSKFKEAYFGLQRRFGFDKVYDAMNAVLEYQSANRADGLEAYKKDTLATVFVKALGFEGIDTRGTALDNTAYGSVIYDLREDSIRYSLKDSEIDDAINQSMTMEQAKDMIQRAFVIGGIKEWFEGEYKNGDEWLKGEGADAVALVVENEWTLQQKFLDKVQGVLDGDFFAVDIIEAYEKGTLTGKVKQNVVKRLDTPKPTSAKDTRVFAPKEIENAQEIYKVALERVTNSNREKVYQARADIIMFAHNRGAAETLGLTQSELNKKLATWARYTARAKEVSMRINSGVALFNRWTGIENSNVLNRAAVSQAELDNLVKEVTGDSNGWQRSYIMRTMLALDTHIDYSELNFEFVGTPKTTMGKSVNGLYDNSKRKITVKYNAPHTVAHEMGHLLDYQWARDFGLTHSALTEGFGRDAQTDADVKQFLTNFDEFIEQIENSADLRSEYTMGRKEVFARFVAKFVQWVDLVANGKRSYAQEYLSYNDKFTTAQYVEFVRLLQEKSMLDAKRIENKSFPLEDVKSNGVEDNKADVSFSLKGTSDISTKDRAELLDIIEHLKGEFEVTKFAKADPKKLAKMTRDLLKEYDSHADFDETFKAIDELYLYMANGEDGHTEVWDEVYSRAYNVAREIVKNALVTDDYMYQEYKSLRDYLRTTAMKFDATYDSVPTSYENFNDFRRHNMGRLKFTKDGMGIGVVYQELASLYPEFFDAEVTSSADQLERMVDVLDEIQPTEVNPYDGNVKQASMHLANDLVSRFFDIPQAKPTFADKAERRVVEAHIKGGKKVEAVRQQKDAKIKKLIEAQREKTKKQLDKVRQQRDAKVEKEKAKRREAISKMSEKQKAKVLRARIVRHVGELDKKLVNPTDNQHIPYELQGVVAKLLECINLESNYTYDPESQSYKKNDEGLPSKRTQAFNELKKVYDNIASSVVVDPDLLGEGGLLSDVISLADKRIADMTSSELETVWQTIRAIEASVSTANKIFSQGKFATILEFAEALRDDNAWKKEKTEYKGVIGKGKKLATLDMLTPETYFHYLGGAGDSVFRMMRDAQDKHISIMKEVAAFTRKTLKGVDVNSLEKTMHTVKLGGEDVQLSTAQLMELYVLMKREQAVEHILIGGILPDVTEGKGAKLNIKAEPIRNLSMAEISEATSILTAEQKKIADELQKFVSTVLSAYGNEASMQVYNYEKFLEQNYWTIRTNKQEIASEVGKDAAVTSVANKGMAKGTKPHANTSVRIGSIFDTFASHSSDMATYAAWLGTSEDVNRIRNFVFWDDGVRTGTVKGILDTVHGIHGSEYLQKLLTDIAIGVKGTDNMNPFDKFVGAYKAASVGANLRVVIQQPTAILRALDMIEACYIAKGTANPLKGWEKAKKYAPIAQWKDWGHFDINTGRQMKDVLFDNASVLEKTKQVGMWGASKADSLSWGLLWNAVEAETKAKHKEIEVGTDAYYETVAKRFTEIVDHTQVVDGILQRSQIMRSPDALTKMATSFMGEPTKQYNMAVAAAYDVINGKGDAKKKAVARLGRTAASLAVAGIVNACAQSIVDAMRDDDKEKDYWEKWLSAFGDNVKDVANPLGYIPFAKDIVSIFQGYDVKRMDAEAITKTFNAITNIHKAVTGTGKYTIAEASAQLFAEIGRLYGLPIANIKRDVKSLVMTIAIETDNYLMQYRVEKAMLDINYSGNNKNFMDILFNAYNNDREAYELIYKDMLKSGYEADKIQSGMESRMRKAEGVTKSSELSKRFMTPTVEEKYDKSLDKVKSSDVWKSANAQQKKNAKADLYDYLTSEGMEEARAEARSFGVDETEYTLWQLAIEMADQPKGQTGSGSYDYKEKAEAINSLNLGDEEIAYFFGKGLTETAKEEVNEVLNAGIDMQEYVNFKAAVSDMKADKYANGKSIPNSKKRKVVDYLNNANLTNEEWAYFYYEIMNYKK